MGKSEDHHLWVSSQKEFSDEWTLSVSTTSTAILVGGSVVTVECGSLPCSDNLRIHLAQSLYKLSTACLGRASVCAIMDSFFFYYVCILDSMR